MATISKPNTFSAGAVIVASEHNSNNDTIYNDYNGNITNVNLASGAAIVDTKLAQLTTPAKVNLSALVITSQAAGDIIYASSATALTRLEAGSSGQFLKSAGTAAPSWATAGKILQVVNVMDGTLDSGTGQIPDDNTAPGITEGTEFMSLAVTPAASANKLKIDIVGLVSTSPNTSNLSMALFEAATTAALASVMHQNVSVAQNLTRMIFSHFMTAATTASMTFSVRAGADTAVTTVFNGAGTVPYGNGTLASSMT